MKTQLLALLLLVSNGLKADNLPVLEVASLAKWTIIVAPEATPGEKYAAQEFQGLLEKAAGFRLPIASKAASAQHNIYIGPGERPASIAITENDLGDEGLRIRITPENIAIAGGRPRGTLYGVYEFMERYLGVRFLTADHTYVPNQRRGQIRCEEWRYTPPFTFRWSYYKENADQPEFAARLRINTVTHADKLGGVTPQNLISHTLGHFLPASKYGQEHPEYFALVDGERKLEMDGGGPEVCVSNPDVIEIVAANVIKDLDQHPNLKNISVSQNDNAAYCRCARCEEINQREGTPMGSHLAFVNAVAERVERKHPDVKIGTLAYWYTRKTPKTIKPRHNVQIQLCSIECSTLFPLDDPGCAKNRAFCEDMDAWGKVCKDIWIWNYNTNFRYYDLPFPNLRVITPNIRYFLKNQVKGVFMQANGNGNTGELCDLRNYVISRCLWNPQLDGWELAKEFCRLHYGKAGPVMISYLTFLHDNAEKAGWEPTCFPMPFEVGVNPASAAKIYDYFQTALKRAENDTVRARVEKASICSYRAILETCGKLELQDGKIKVVYPERFGPVVETYTALTKKHGQTRAEEWQPIDQYYKLLESVTRQGWPGAQLENAVWRLKVLAEDHGNVVELHHKPSNRDLLMPPAYRSVRRLFEHFTLRDIGEQGYKSKESGPYLVMTEPGGVMMAKTLTNGTTLKRRIWFDKQNPGAIHFQTQLSGVEESSSPRTAAKLRVHPEFYTGTLSKDSTLLSAYIKDGSWIVFNDGWNGSNGPKRALLEKAKGGGYAFYNHRDRFGVRLIYDPAAFDRPAFSWNDTYPEVSLDLHSKTKQLGAGESLSFEYQLDYLSRPPQ